MGSERHQSLVGFLQIVAIVPGNRPPAHKNRKIAGGRRAEIALGQRAAVVLSRFDDSAVFLGFFARFTRSSPDFAITTVGQCSGNLRLSAGRGVCVLPLSPSGFIFFLSRAHARMAEMRLPFLPVSGL
jgi:hypothetical protein